MNFLLQQHEQKQLRNAAILIELIKVQMRKTVIRDQIIIYRKFSNVV